MKIVALFAALIAERLFSQFFRWREFRWLDPLFDVGIRASARLHGVAHYAWVIGVLLIAVAPVVILRIALDDTLLGLPYFALSVVVLFLSLGPEDLGEVVDHWCRAVSRDDSQTEEEYSARLLESSVDDGIRVRDEIAGAVLAQANNRVFAVLFWFVIFGPIGAWAVRVADLARRRAGVLDAATCERSADDVHAWLAWAPARLTALGFSLAGHYDAAIESWRGAALAGMPRSQSNAMLLQQVGLAAMSLVRQTDESDEDWAVRRVSRARKLVYRTLGFWLVGIALLTLVGVLV
ncbi:MAG: regulatory signaling modulator protein AmpE [Pseudomonadota bacterium]